MVDREKELQQIKKLHSNYTSCGKAFNTEYAWGFMNGLEAALALLEHRPPFYLDKNGNYDKFDQENYPEYFL